MVVSSSRNVVGACARIPVAASAPDASTAANVENRSRQLLKSSNPQILKFPFSERDISVLLRRILVALRFEAPQRGNELAPRLARLNHLVDESAASGYVRAGELLAILGHLLGAQGGRVARGVEL